MCSFNYVWIILRNIRSVQSKFRLYIISVKLKLTLGSKINSRTLIFMETCYFRYNIYFCLPSVQIFRQRFVLQRIDGIFRNNRYFKQRIYLRIARNK